MDSDIDSPDVLITSQSTLIPAVKVWEQYLKDQDRTIHTRKAFLGDINLLARFLPPDQPLGAISTTDLNNFLNWLQSGRGVPCSPKSLARRITSLKAFFKWLVSYGIIPSDPAEKVLQRTVQSPLPTILNREEMGKVLNAAVDLREKEPKPDTRYHALLLLLLETGIKKEECRKIHVNHVSFEDTDDPMVYIRYSSTSSSYKDRKIRVSNEWVDSLKLYLAQYNPTEELFKWSPRQLEYLLEDISNKAMIDKHLSFGMCRWTCAVADWAMGVDPTLIRQKLGISKIQWREVSNKLRLLADQF